jgi:DICT domain-containing protein/GGDEF domain-containing protein
MINQQVTTKRVLVAVSHAIERFADAGRADHQTIVVAMFQRLSYFHREIETYRRIAERAAVTVIGLVEDLPPALPPGIAHVLLTEDEPLAREWSVSVLNPHAGATLVASDLQAVDPEAPTLEAGRRFAGGWSFCREDAYAEVLRLRSALELRLSAEASAAMDEVLRRVVSTPARNDDCQSDAAIRHLAQQMDLAGRRGGILERDRDATPALNASEWDGVSGLRNARYLDRWVRGGAAGTLPLGMLLLDVPGIDEVNHRYGTRAGVAALRRVGETLQRPLGASDRAISLGHGRFLALLPATTEPGVRQVHDQVAGALQGAEQHFPFVPLSASAVATVTRERPLPIPTLVRAARDVRPSEVALL